MTKFTKNGSGLILPSKPPEPTKLEKKYKNNPLVVTNEEDRKELSDLFNKIINHSAIRPQLLPNHSRQEVAFAFARLILGEEWDCEVYC